jgi:hypothetical protein
MIWNIPSTVYQVYGMGILIGIPYQIITSTSNVETIPYQKGISAMTTAHEQTKQDTRTDSAGTQGDPKDVRTYAQDRPPHSSDCRGTGRDGKKVLSGHLLTMPDWSKPHKKN